MRRKLNFDGGCSLWARSVFLALFLAGFPMAPRIANACGNSYTQYYVLRGAREQLERAELDLARGANLSAFRSALEIVGVAEHGVPVRSITRDMRDMGDTRGPRWAVTLHDGAYSGPEDTAGQADRGALFLRARVLRGIAMARLDGQFNSHYVQLRRASPAQREARFQESLADFTAALAVNPTDPRVRAYQAETQARRDASAAPAALTTLRDLARRDVLPDAWSWVMLARLETDAAARTQALQRCTTLAGRNASRVCVVPTP